MSLAFAVIGGLGLGWLFCGVIWCVVARLVEGCWPSIFNFYFVWRWQRD